MGRKTRLVVAASLSLYVAWLIFGYRYHLVDGVNLLVHEAGHLFFAPFGETLGMLGGTILQLLFPLLFVFYFLSSGQKLEAGVCTVWLAESGMYTAEYMADANEQALPLVGGHLHDWRWLFQRNGILDSAEQIATAVHVSASLLAIMAVWLVWREALARSAGSAARTHAGAAQTG